MEQTANQGSKCQYWKQQTSLRRRPMQHQHPLRGVWMKVSPPRFFEKAFWGSCGAASYYFELLGHVTPSHSPFSAPFVFFFEGACRTNIQDATARQKRAQRKLQELSGGRHAANPHHYAGEEGTHNTTPVRAKFAQQGEVLPPQRKKKGRPKEAEAQWWQLPLLQ